MTTGLPFVIKVTSVISQQFTSWCTKYLTMCEFVAKAGRVGVFTLPWCRHIHFTLYQTGRGIVTETCWVNDVFPPDYLMFSALVLKLAYVIYPLHIAVFTVDTLPWDGFVPGFAITNNGPKA